MAITNINKSIFTKHGTGDALVSPSCGQKVNMSIFESIGGPIDTLVLGKKDTEYFAVCPSCGDNFGINPDYMYERKSGTTVYMTESDLIKKEKSNKNA